MQLAYTLFHALAIGATSLYAFFLLFAIYGLVDTFLVPSTL